MNFCSRGVPRSQFLKNSGDFWELFWGVFRAATLALYIQERFGSFFEEIYKNSVLFWELLGLFGSKQKLFGVLRVILKIAQNFFFYFLCYFLKNSEFGRTPEFREQGTALFYRYVKLLLAGAAQCACADFYCWHHLHSGALRTHILCMCVALL